MIVLIDNYDSFTYNLYQCIARFVPTLVVMRNDVKSLEEFLNMQIEGLILSPGPGYPKDAGLMIPLIQHLAPKIPILGVCLGHQAIAEAFGGKVVNAGEIVHGKSCLIYHTQEGIFEGLPLPFPAGRYHSLVAEPESFPSVLSIEARTENGKIMALRHREYPTWGVQFHPESILTPDGPKLIENFLVHYNLIPHATRIHFS